MINLFLFLNFNFEVLTSSSILKDRSSILFRAIFCQRWIVRELNVGRLNRSWEPSPHALTNLITDMFRWQCLQKGANLRISITEIILLEIATKIFLKMNSLLFLECEFSVSSKLEHVETFIPCHSFTTVDI